MFYQNKLYDSPRVLVNRYEIIKKLGTGTFGTVFLVKDLLCNGELKVSKEISLGELKPDETVDAIREAKLLSRLDHPNIVKFYDSFVDGNFFCIITEYCEGGDLSDEISQKIKGHQTFEETTVLSWFVQLVLAIKYIHSRRVLHRDIKTRNIFLKNNMVKIGDFGISRLLMGTMDMASTFVGTPYFMSPEVLKHEGYNSKSDIWSLGCILYELCTLTHAFDGQSLMAVMYKITEGQIPDLPKQYSSQFNDLFKRMLQKNPNDRPSATDISKLDFVSQHITNTLDSLSEYIDKDNLDDNPEEEAENIAQLLESKSTLNDLIQDPITRQLTTLTPSQLLKVKKEIRANEKAQLLQEATLEQLKQTIERKEAIRKVKHSPHIPAWKGGRGDGEMLREALTVKNVKAPKHSNIGDSKSATLSSMMLSSITRQPHLLDTQRTLSSSLSLSSKTVIHKPLTPHQSDERPITPMKNKMVYDVNNSSLDFKDGIPDEAAAADTFYSQFDDFESQPTDDTHEECQPTDDDHDSDEESLVQCLEGALSATDKDSTFVVSSDKDMSPYSPTVRNAKIQNLTAECERILGKESFQQAYDYLKKMRYSSAAGKVKESEIFQGLRKFVRNIGDCFLLDQLLFLEEQAKVSNF